MTAKKVTPFGSWKSPVEPSHVSSAGTSVQALATDADCLYWLEARPLEQGRNVIVMIMPDGAPRDITPRGFDVRTRVHEYGGGAFVIDCGTVIFANFSDQRLYIHKIGEQPRPLTPPDVDLRYGDLVVDRKRARVICIRQDHRRAGEPVNTLVAINLKDGGAGEVLFEGTDFVSSPRPSPNGKSLAFITWNHPDMPWDKTALHVAELDETGQTAQIKTLQHSGEGAVTQPKWSPGGILYFIADWSNWWNLYRYDNGKGVELHPLAAEFCPPPWVFGQSNYIFRNDRELVASYTKDGFWHLASLDLTSNTLTDLAPPLAGLSNLVSTGKHIYFLADHREGPTHALRLDKNNKIVAPGPPSPVHLSSQTLARPQSISFPTANKDTAYGFFYAPTNKAFQGPQNARPPLLVKIHGGPTAAASAAFSYKIQYWTSRGIAVLDINYRGSTGFGRDFRQKLNGAWGVADVEDACAGAKFLADSGKVDPSRLAISGASAGGLTVLNALAHHDIFSAGGSFYGVSDLLGLVEDTHKFEARYCDRLIGKYPRDIDIYKERSPITAVDKITAPVLILQGQDDLVVPPDQSEKVFEALKKNKVPVAYIAFEGEQHGFRRAENIERAITAELAFYGKVFGFEPAPHGKSKRPEPLNIINHQYLK